MKLILSLLIYLSPIFSLSGQTKTIIGKILSEDLDVMPGVQIRDSDSTVIGITNIEGKFEIKIPPKTNKLIFASVGFEWTNIQLDSSCHCIELIMMYNVSYDFISPIRVNRLRTKRFKSIPHLRKLAFEKRLFNFEKSCFTQKFLSAEERLE